MLYSYDPIKYIDQMKLYIYFGFAWLTSSIPSNEKVKILKVNIHLSENFAIEFFNDK